MGKPYNGGIAAANGVEAALLTESGFIVWMAIPFKSLRFRDSEQQTWGIAL